MARVNISNLHFAYDGGDALFSDVSLQLDTQWKLGLLGRNGRGKTTLLNILLGRLEYEGTIVLPLPTDYFPYPIADKSRETLEIMEEIADFERWQIERELSLLNVSEDVLLRPFETLSGGEQTKILLATLFLNENRFLLLDEPTNHLDLEGRRIIGEYLRKKSGFILVSHDRTLLDRCVDHILSINRSDIELTQGNYSTWKERQEIREKFENAENRRLIGDINKLKDSAKQTSDWSRQAEKKKYGNGPVDRGFLGSKAARIMKQAKIKESRQQKAIEEKTTLFKNSEVEDRLSITPLRFHSTRILDLSDVSVRFGEKILLEHFSLSLDAGERIALCGKNGCGKSSLLKLIAGEENIPFQGRRSIPSSLKISYLPQDTSSLHGGLRTWISERQLDESRFKTLLHKLGLPKGIFENDLSEYSEGQKKKVLLAENLCTPAHLYVWDEPLNYIDVISRIQIENLLVECRPTLIFVEHDKTFLDTVATKIIKL